MSRLHPKVAWAAVATALTTAVLSIAQAQGYNLNASWAGGATAIIAALAGYAGPQTAAVVAGAPQDTDDSAPPSVPAPAPSRVSAAISPVQEAADIVTGVMGAIATFGAPKPAVPSVASAIQTVASALTAPTTS